MKTQRRRGFTLIELIVTVTILGIMSGVATLALRRPAPADPNDPRVIIAKLRRTALRDGVAQSGTALVDGRLVDVTAFPDGTAAADSALHLNRLTGRELNVAR